MSRTLKELPGKKRFLEVVKRADETYDLFLDDAPDSCAVSEKWLPDELCVRFGFCGEEYDSILRQLNLNGRARLLLSS